MPAPPPIPTILTKANWDKEKGIFAKMAGKTGVGEAMKEVAVAYGNVDWTKFDAKIQCQAVKQMSVIDGKREEAKVEYTSKVEKLREKVKDLRDLATTTQANFKKKATIPASSTKHVGKVAAEADEFWMALKGNSSYFDAVDKGYDAVAEDLRKKQELAAKTIKGYIKSISEEAKTVLSNPTVDQYKGKATKGFHQGVRGLGASLAVQSDPEIKKLHAEWVHFITDSFLPKEDDEVKPKVKQVLAKLKELQSLVA